MSIKISYKINIEALIYRSEKHIKARDDVVGEVKGSGLASFYFKNPVQLIINVSILLYLFDRV